LTTPGVLGRVFDGVDEIVWEPYGCGFHRIVFDTANKTLRQEHVAVASHGDILRPIFASVGTSRYGSMAE
jgi:hypothetical protein